MTGGMIPLDLIDNANPTYARRDFGDLGALAEHLRVHGQTAPILVASDYLVLDGARRIEALKLLGANAVWGVAVSRWPAAQQALLDASARHAAGEPHLPRKLEDLLDLLPVLTEMMIRAPRDTTARQGSVARVVALASGDYSESQMRQASAIARRIREARIGGQPELADSLLALVRSCDRGEISQNRLYLLGMKLSLGESLASRSPAISTASTLAQQKKTMDSTLSMMVGAVRALPDPSEFDLHHDPEDLERWLVRFKEITTPLARVAKRIRTVQEPEREKDQS